ncbi:hypothetical protein ACFVRU_38530, partial [Streptomyces sp. NPDC057927]
KSHTDIKLLGEVFPAVSSDNNSGNTVIANFGATPFVYPVPNGYRKYNQDILDNILILHNEVYKKYDYADSSWKTVTILLPTEIDYVNGNSTTEISSLPESAWKELNGTVELCYYTNNTTITEAQFNIETEPFTLAEEFGDSIKVIEYTDNPEQVDSKVILETEPFEFYDEMGNHMDVLYYTDDQEVNNAELEITHNHSPLDELEGDFEVVTWTDSDEDLDLNMNALPYGQIVVEKNDLELYGDIKQIIVNKQKDGLLNGIIRLAISYDSGTTWSSYKNDVWTNIDVSSPESFISKGMTIDDVSNIDFNAFFSKINKETNSLKLAYYIEENIRNTDSAKIKNIDTIQSVALETPQINKASFYIVNTVSTINLQLKGRDLNGKIEDVDHGQVKYKISLNGNPYYPVDGEFTSFEETPVNISIKINADDIIIDEFNTLRVDIEDYWGETDYWESTPFKGSYNGLIFKDPVGEYYSNDIGKILKYLDMGTLIAGQVSTEAEIHLYNTYGYDVKDVVLTPKTDSSGILIELSKKNDPFIAEKQLSWDTIIDGEGETFYLRLVTKYTTPAVMGGTFELRVDANEVETL